MKIKEKMNEREKIKYIYDMKTRKTLCFIFNKFYNTKIIIKETQSIFK